MSNVLRSCVLGLAVALFVIAGTARAEEPAKKPAKATPPEKAEKTKSTTGGVVITRTPPATNKLELSEVALAPAGTALLEISNKEAAGTLAPPNRQVGPETVLKEPRIRSLDERGGALRYLAKEPKAVNLLQLINPFAPMHLGQGGRLVNEWSPLDGAAPVPRGFRDERTHEPGSVLIGFP